MIVGKYRQALDTDSADTSFASKIPTLTKPAGNGVLDLAAGVVGVAASYTHLRLTPFGRGDDNDVFEMRVLGWCPVGEGASRLWVPVPLAAFTCTLSTAVVVANGALEAADRFVDTIAAATIPIEATLAADTTRAGSVMISSPANNLIGFVLMPTYGFGVFEFTFDATTGDPTAMNCLVAVA